MTPNWFVAWPVRGADAWLADLAKDAPGGLHFLAPADVHVTLAFLGRYEPWLLKKMTSLLKGLPIKEIDVTPDRLVALPQPRRFSALAFSLAGGRFEVEDQITRWRDRLCREVGAPIESRPMLPHFTVARPDRRIGEADRDETLAWLEQLPPQPHLRLHLDAPRVFSWADKTAPTRYQLLD